jgi:hypothetical protein
VPHTSEYICRAGVNAEKAAAPRGAPAAWPRATPRGLYVRRRIRRLPLPCDGRFKARSESPEGQGNLQRCRRRRSAPAPAWPGGQRGVPASSWRDGKTPPSISRAVQFFEQLAGLLEVTGLTGMIETQGRAL